MEDLNLEYCYVEVKTRKLPFQFKVEIFPYIIDYRNHITFYQVYYNKFNKKYSYVKNK